MPRPRFERAAPEKRAAILDAAATEFAAHGYDGASVNRILLAAGFSKGAFYYYFDDKADLAAAVIDRESLQWLKSLDQLELPNDAGEFWAVLNSFFERSLAEMRRAPGRADALTRLGVAIAKSPELMQRLGPMISDANEKVSALWRRGQEVGAVRTDLPASAIMALLQTMKLTLATVMMPADRAPSAEELKHFSYTHLDLIRRICELRPPPPGRP